MTIPRCDNAGVRASVELNGPSPWILHSIDSPSSIAKLSADSTSSLSTKSHTSSSSLNRNHFPSHVNVTLDSELVSIVVTIEFGSLEIPESFNFSNNVESIL